jgi:hypothetical protein
MPAGRSGYSAGFTDPSQIVGMVGDILPAAGLGEIQPYRGKTYQYVRFDNGVGNVAAVAGQACYWRDLANFIVTSDISDSLAGATELAFCAGVFLYAVTDLYYCWIQCGGLATSVKLSGAGAPGQILIPSVTDGVLTTVATGSVTAAQAGAQRVGTQILAAVATLATVYLTVREG